TIVYENQKISYSNLHKLTSHCTRMIRDLAKRGERVAIIARDCPEFIISFLATVAAGAVAVPISTMLNAAELKFILDDCKPRVLICTSDQIKKLQLIRKNLSKYAHVLL